MINQYTAGKVTATDLLVGAQAAGSAGGDLQTLPKPKAQKKRKRRGKLQVDSRHSSRTVQRFLRKTANLPPPYMTTIPMWDHKLNKQIQGKIKLYPIHESLDRVVAEGAEAEWGSFDESQASFRTGLEEWGSRVGATLAGIWMCLALWGDAAPYTHKDSIYLLTCRVLNGSHRTRVWIAGFSKRRLCACGCFGRCTFNALFDVVSWSMKAYLTGKWPDRDHLGEPLQGWRREMAGKPFRFKAAIIAKCGDWAWHKQILGMRSWSARLNCWLCQATLGETDFTANAPWRRTIRSHSAFLAESMGKRKCLSTIFAIPGFVLGYVLPDFMHVSCLGIVQYLEGNVMWELFVVLDGRYKKPLDACSRLLNMINIVARECSLEPPFAELTIGMIKPQGNKRPRMRLKAAEGRTFLPLLTRMLEKFFPAENERDALRLQCCQALCRVYLELRQ